MLRHFSEIQTSAPDLDQLSHEYATYRDALSRPGTNPEKTIRQWDRTRRKTLTWQHLVELQFNQDTSDPLRSERMKQCDRLSPQLIELDNSIKDLALHGPHREQLLSSFGSQVFELWKAECLAFAPAIKDHLVAEADLVADYNSLLSSARIGFHQQTWTLEGIDQFRFSHDRDLRHGSMQAKWEWLGQQGQQLDDQFAQLVRLRDTMAKTLGFGDYREMGYLKRCRIDYGPDDVESFRNQVRAHVIPFCQELLGERARKMGIDQVMFWDESVHSTRKPPAPGGDHRWILEHAGPMFTELCPQIGDFHAMMCQMDLFDLPNRPNKAGGGFCTDFPEHGIPYIFANLNSTADDVRVFIHEMGHAYQGFCSRNQPLYEYVWPTYETCEIHSMGLEFMAFPVVEHLIPVDSDRYCREHVIDSFLFLPYAVAVDHFQHRVYETPSATPNERLAMWKEMERLYLPWRDYGDLPRLPEGGRWQLQRHIYMEPFYYIDYALALCCALQLWRGSRKNMPETLSRYQFLCDAGGTLPCQTLVSTAGLDSPFAERTVAECVATARSFLNGS